LAVSKRECQRLRPYKYEERPLNTTAKLRKLSPFKGIVKILSL
jgi:hypothetical protein